MTEKTKRYKTIEKISEGQFGTVFKALDTQTSKWEKSKQNSHYSLDEIVAIKKIYVSLKHSSPAASKVQREIDLMKQINHPNVPGFIDMKILLKRNRSSDYWIIKLKKHVSNWSWIIWNMI